MRPYLDAHGITLYLGDCIEVMRELPPSTVDTVLTDPPFSSGGRRENARSRHKADERYCEVIARRVERAAT